jgi:hypothetical protein
MTIAVCCDCGRDFNTAELREIANDEDFTLQEAHDRIEEWGCSSVGFSCTPTPKPDDTAQCLAIQILSTYNL